MLANRRLARTLLALFVGLTILGRPVTPSRACPFCSSVSITFGEELKGATAGVVATLAEMPQATPAPDGENRPLVSDSLATFDVVTVLKGQELLGDAKQIKVTYFGQDKIGTPFLINGADSPQVVWNTPVPLTERGVEYVSKLSQLPESGPDRLAYFQEYLEDSEEMLARDAYDEFAKAPYGEVKGLKDRMHKDKLLGWIKKSEVPPSRRRLYLTMVGVCGDQNDLPMLEEIIKSDDRDMKTALDAVVACYLTLAGPDGLPLVEDRFLKNPDAEYTDTYAAIMALRFHGQEEQIVPKERLVKSLEYMLDRPQLADLVIPDLARWEDWQAMDRLVKLFKEANDDTSWVRVPVINYLNACPLPQAKEYITELAQIDPDAVKRATSAFPFAGAVPAPAPPPEGATASNANEAAAVAEAVATITESPTSETTEPAIADEGNTTEDVAQPEPKVADATTPAAIPDDEEAADTAVAKGEPLVEPRAASTTPVWLVVAVPVAGGLLLFGIFALLLRGQRRQTNV